MDLLKAVYNNCIDLRITGSAAIDLSYIAAGRAMAHFCRHLNPWDYAGGSAILTESGGIVSQWDGTPMPYAGKHTSLAASNKAIHEAMLDLVGRFL
jgi:myo-inositol-1(or 4)-monophosphatase